MYEVLAIIAVVLAVFVAGLVIGHSKSFDAKLKAVEDDIVELKNSVKYPGKM